MTTLRLTTLRCDRILVTLGLCTSAGACDTFAESPTHVGESDPPLPAVRPVPLTPTVTIVPGFSPPPTATVVSTIPPVPPQNTGTAAIPTLTVPSSLPVCPPPTAEPPTEDTATSDGTASAEGAASYSASSYSAATNGVDSSVGVSGAADVSSSAALSADAGNPRAATEKSGDAGVLVNSGDSATLLPSGDAILVDDLTLLIIFDNSGSMAECWDGKTRWEHANHALRAAIEPAQHSLNVGAIRFPADTECLVDPFESANQFAFDVGHEFLADWEAGARYPIGGTPLAAAMVEADKAIQTAAAAGLLEERFRVVIITDGEPNCDGSPNLLTTLPTAWRAQGVETRVLGLPGSDSAAALLQSIADAGGGIYEQLTTPGQLHDSAERAAR